MCMQYPSKTKEILTVTVFAYLILISMDFYDFSFPVSVSFDCIRRFIKHIETVFDSRGPSNITLVIFVGSTNVSWSS